MGDEVLKLKSSGNAVINIAAILLAGVSAAWFIVHSLLEEETQRVILGGAAQAASQAIQTFIMLFAKILEKIEEKTNEAHTETRCAVVEMKEEKGWHRKLEEISGGYLIHANQLALLSRPPKPPDVKKPCVITVMAADYVRGGRVNVRGCQGVRITAGPWGQPETSSDSTNGVEIIVFDDQNVTIKRGLKPTDQKIEMTPAGITIDAGTGILTLKSATQIKLSMNDTNTMTLDAKGVKIVGAPIIALN